eukprot:SAG22_NODE_24_length_30194_cov_6.086327_7_plen_396_part_00
MKGKRISPEGQYVEGEFGQSPRAMLEVTNAEVHGFDVPERCGWLIFEPVWGFRDSICRMVPPLYDPRTAVYTLFDREVFLLVLQFALLYYFTTGSLAPASDFRASVVPVVESDHDGDSEPWPSLGLDNTAVHIWGTTVARSVGAAWQLFRGLLYAQAPPAADEADPDGPFQHHDEGLVHHDEGLPGVTTNVIRKKAQDLIAAHVHDDNVQLLLNQLEARWRWRWQFGKCVHLGLAVFACELLAPNLFDFPYIYDLFVPSEWWLLVPSMTVCLLMVLRPDMNKKTDLRAVKPELLSKATNGLFEELEYRWLRPALTTTTLNLCILLDDAYGEGWFKFLLYTAPGQPVFMISAHAGCACSSEVSRWLLQSTNGQWVRSPQPRSCTRTCLMKTSTFIR